MNGSAGEREGGSPPAGGRTSGDGTAVPVRVSAEREGRRALGMFLAGPVIWTLHFLVVYLAVEAGCTGDGPGLSLLDPPAPTLITLAGTAVAALACLASAWWALKHWRHRSGSSEDGPAGERSDGGDMLALGGFLLSLLGFVVVLFVGLPALVLPACG